MKYFKLSGNKVPSVMTVSCLHKRDNILRTDFPAAMCFKGALASPV